MEVERHFAGGHIALTLTHRDSPRLLPYYEVLATMLHELAHFVSHPHDSIFDAELKRLKAVQASISKGREGYEGAPEFVDGVWRQTPRPHQWVGAGRVLGRRGRSPPPDDDAQAVDLTLLDGGRSQRADTRKGARH